MNEKDRFLEELDKRGSCECPPMPPNTVGGFQILYGVPVCTRCRRRIPQGKTQKKKRPRGGDMGEQQAKERPELNCDQESWVVARLVSLVDCAYRIAESRRVEADDPMFQGSLRGAINGAAIEIIRSLGLEPEYTNIQKQTPRLIRPPSREPQHILNNPTKEDRE